jgi:hypothetical protein
MKATILDRNGLKTVNLNRRRAIREKCLNCSCWSLRGVQDCTFEGCPLQPLRSGTGKQNAAARTTVFDYVDSQVGVLKAAFRNRRRVYANG